MQYNNYHVKRIYLALLTLYDPSPRVMEIKTKGNKWDLIKLKRFCTAKEILSKVKRQTSEWEKLIANGKD